MSVSVSVRVCLSTEGTCTTVERHGKELERDFVWHRPSRECWHHLDLGGFLFTDKQHTAWWHSLSLSTHITEWSLGTKVFLSYHKRL